MDALGRTELRDHPLLRPPTAGIVLPADVDDLLDCPVPILAEQAYLAANLASLGLALGLSPALTRNPNTTKCVPKLVTSALLHFASPPASPVVSESASESPSSPSRSPGSSPVPAPGPVPALPVVSSAKRSRRRIPVEQKMELVAAFNKNNTPPTKELRTLSLKFGTPLRRIQYWFQNRRRGRRIREARLKARTENGDTPFSGEVSDSEEE
ncbi:hypothetical protein BC830DRAFT_1169448 [Chytriomyces sp. MP71]|nr:hypothetical protein BC830DRAFT_1169448 [Chytriomyces sp. MP71]